MEYCVVFVTAGSYGEGRKIAACILKKKLAACVNIVKDIESFYWWQGRIEHSKESLLIIKTRKQLQRKLFTEVKKLHSYKVPEMIALPITGGSRDYLEWIKKSTEKV